CLHCSARDHCRRSARRKIVAGRHRRGCAPDRNCWQRDHCRRGRRRCSRPAGRRGSLRRAGARAPLRSRRNFGAKQMTPFTTATQASSELAIAGGQPLASSPFSPWPHFEQEDLDAAERVLRSGKINYWTGEQGREFEREFAAYVGCKYAVAVANGSVGLELALYALGIGPGDEVIVPSRTFVATATSVLMRGATPVFADIHRDSQNLTAETIAPLITPRTKAIIPVHLAGWPCDMDPILELGAAHKLKVIEDCAQAHGARYKGRPVGSMGDINSFSSCQDKIIST